MTQTSDSNQRAAVQRQLVDHCGKPLAAGTTCAFLPPPEIGEVLSADPDVREEHRGAAICLIVILATMVTMCLWMIWYALTAARRSDVDLIWGCVVVTMGLAGLCLWGLMKALYPPRQLGYVGKQGIALFAAGKSGDCSILQFSEVRDLHVKLLHKKMRRGFFVFYIGTTYSYRWDGSSQFELKGLYHNSKERPHEHHPVYFARAAEAAWTRFALPRYVQEFNTTKFMMFPIDGGNCVRVGKGLLQFDYQGTKQAITQAEIAVCTLHNGMFSIKHKDAKWFSNTGNFRFMYKDMANARIFVFALDRLMNIKEV